MSFVQTSGTRFTLNSVPWIPVGGATYGYYGSNAAYLNRINAAVNSGFNILRHVNFMRTLPYPDYYDPTANAEKNEEFWGPMDYGLNQARIAGVKVLLDISDMCGFAEQREYELADSNFMLMYKNFVEWLAERENTYNGIKYKNDDTIAIFAIAGELGNLAPGVGYTLFDTIGGNMKNAGFQQLIHAGGMKPEQIVDASYGFGNYNPIDILSSSNIDCASTHPYYTFANMEDLFPDIQSYSVTKNKPWFIEEFGFAKADNQKRSDLRQVFKLGFQNGSAGGLIWNLDEGGTDGYGYSGFGVSTLGRTPESYQLMKTMAWAKGYSARDCAF